MYQPKLARFMSRDPMPANGITVLSPVPDMRKYWNPASEPYVYVGNNPANFVDPSGLVRSFCGESDFKPYIDPVDIVDGKPVIDMKEVIGTLWVSASIDAVSAPSCRATPFFPDTAFLRVYFHGFHTKRFNPLSEMEVVRNDNATTLCKHTWSATEKSMTSEWHCPIECTDNHCRDYHFQTIVYLKSKHSDPQAIPLYYTRPGQMIAIEAKASFDSSCCLINSCQVEARVCQLLTFGIPNSQSPNDPPPTTPPILAPGVPGIIEKHCGPWKK